MKEKSNKKLIMIIILFLILIIGTALFIFKDNIFAKEDVSDIEETNSIVVSQNIIYSEDEIGNLLIVADIVLKEELLADEELNIDLVSFDKEGNIISTYLASTKYFTLNKEKEIHMAFDDNNPDDISKIDKIEATITKQERTMAATDSYDFVEDNTPEVVEFESLYRVFMPLEDVFKNLKWCWSNKL